VKHLVVLSQFASAEDSPVRFLRYHAAVEWAVQHSGLAWTFLRTNLFMQGQLQFKGMIAATGAFAAATALTEDGHEGRTYDLTGPEALTYAEMADRLTGSPARPESKSCFTTSPRPRWPMVCAGRACPTGRSTGWSKTTPIIAGARQRSSRQTSRTPPA